MPDVIVRVPATTANLGPGFDCLAMALDLWNETVFSPGGSGLRIEIEGRGQGELPSDESNLLVQAMQRVYQLTGQRPPAGMSIRCRNGIPLGSGLGSSAAAVLTGILGGNALCGGPLEPARLLQLAVEMEGHPDNAAAALFGGLVLIGHTGRRLVTRPLGMVRVGGEPLGTAVVLPACQLSTHDARKVLPREVPLGDAVYNMGMTALVLEALRAGDLTLLGEVMQDRLHQPFRLPLIPGAAEAIQAAVEAGAAAAALSGAGPSVIAFGLEDLSLAAEAMQAAFRKQGLGSEVFLQTVTDSGAEVLVDPD